MNETNQKPLILELDDAKKEFVNFVNNLQSRGLPCYLIEMIMTEGLTQLRGIANMELEAARKQNTIN
jgi:hypothetical protein